VFLTPCSYNVFGPQETFTDSITAIGDCIRELDSRRASSGNANMKLVVSMSFGGNSSVSVMADALAAIAAERSDVLLVASAGNTGDGTVSFPAGYAEVVSGESPHQPARHSSACNFELSKFVALADMPAKQLLLQNVQCCGTFVILQGATAAFPVNKNNTSSYARSSGRCHQTALQQLFSLCSLPACVHCRSWCCRLGRGDS
jgi:hypothetical protein